MTGRSVAGTREVPRGPGAEGGWNALVGAVRRHLLPLFRLRIPVTRLETADRSMVVAGGGTAADYLVRRFFADEPRRRLLFHTTLAALPRVLLECARDADLVLARVERPAAARRFDDRFLRMPESVDLYLEVPDDPAGISRASKGAKHNARLVRGHGLTWSVSHAPADFDDFYRRMYLPFAHRRFGEAAFIRGRHTLAREFRRGGLLWVRRDGAPIAGGLFRVQGPMLCLRGSPGTLEGSADPVQAGAISALYLFAADYARQQGLRWLNFGASLPSLGDGALRFKRSWGAALRDRAQSHHDLLLRWERFSQPVAGFLRETPLIVRERVGSAGGGPTFAALTTVGADPPEAVGRLARKLATPGVARLLVVAPPGWETPRRPDGLKDVTTVWRCAPGPPEEVARTASPMW
jgi:hypothetical protein